MKIGYVIICTTILTLIFSAVITNAEFYKDAENKQHVSIKIKKGWNLVPAYLADSIWGGSWWTLPQLSGESVKVVYLLNPIDKKYILDTSYLGSEVYKEEISTDKKSLLDKAGKDKELLSNLFFSAFWIYSKEDVNIDKIVGEGEIKGTVLEALNGDTMYKGWNFFSITPDLLGYKKLNSIKNDCKITKIVEWNVFTQSWDIGNVPDILEQEILADTAAVGQVVVIKVAENCKLKSEESITAPPPSLPT